MEKLLVVLGAIALVIIIAVIFAFPVKWLWNDVMPWMFGLKEIGVGKALEIELLCGLLFKGTSSSN